MKRHPRDFSSRVKAREASVSTGTSAIVRGTGCGEATDQMRASSTPVALGVLPAHECARIRDDGLDLAPVTDDPFIHHQSIDVRFVVRRDSDRFEAAEGGSEALASTQDRQP